jgi:hypothetical protein
VAAVGFVAGPLLFYALEFWEHVPAITCLAAAMALLATTEPTPPKQIAGGVLAAIAILLRPEALWFVIAVSCWRIYARAPVAHYAAAVVGVLGLFAAFNFLESGSWIGLHASANMAPLLDDWASVRLQRAALWFWPGSTMWMGGVFVLAASWVAYLLGANSALTQTTALLAVAMLALQAATGAYPRESLWSCWPAGLLLLVPSTRLRDAGPWWWIALFTTAAVWLSSTHDGGAQWGPRFVLIAAPAMIVLAAAQITETTRPGWARRFRQVLVIVVLLAGLWATRAAYRELRGTKQFYAQLVDAVDRHVTNGSVLVFSTWWFDQVVASLHSTRTFLYAESAPAGAAILKELQAAGIREAALAWSQEQAEDSVGNAVAGSCYQVVRTDDIPERQVRILTVTCRPAE